MNAMLKKTIESLQSLYRKIRGVDHKILNSYLININKQQDIDSIIFQTSRCLHTMFDYKFFAFAVYDKEYNGGIDIWMSPNIEDISIVKFIRKDFSANNINCNIRNPTDKSGEVFHGGLHVETENILSYKIMDNDTRAFLYLIPRKGAYSHHNELLKMIITVIATAISNFINMKKLENEALIDPLTHCYNRRALNKYIDHDLAYAERNNSDLAAIMFDIDHFKKVNDTYGHKAGDAVLRAVSKSVLAAIRKSDYLARYGGEEFLLIMPETKFSRAIELAERLRKIVENLKISVDDKNIFVTASFGVALYKEGTDKGTLFKKVDEMLYKAKRQGRNRIVPDLRIYHSDFKESRRSEKKEGVLLN